MKYKDPHRKREAEKYGRPIPSREFILETLENADSPMGFMPLCNALDLTEDTDRDALKYRLRAMERDGQLLYNRRRQYIPVSKADLVAGRVIAHPDGFGFLVPDEGGEDLYLSNIQMRQLLHGDRALASVIGIDRKGRREGAVVEVLEHNTEQVVGRYHEERGVGFVIADNVRISQNIIIPKEQTYDAEEGQIVVTAIIEQPTRRSQPIGKIVEILGDHMGPGMEIDIALRSHDLPYIWPDDVNKQCKKFKEEVLKKDKKGRVDIRKLPLVTIDGSDTRDFDDAVYCERDGKNWRLLVAIADVAHYVEVGSPLDQEAWNRGTSIYFPEKVIPMLPEVLSNGLCSLNPHVDRLCMVADIRIDPQGDVISYDFFEGLMKSAARLTYTEMAQIVVDKNKEVRATQRGRLKYLDNLYTLYKILRRQRTKRGAIDFETKETRIIYGANKKIDRIVLTARNDAHKLIEECMIIANVCAAKFVEKHKIPNLHRAHPTPEAGRVEDLRSFLGTMGLSLPGSEEPKPQDYAVVLKKLKKRADAQLIQTVLLRSMSQATYSPDSSGHFGLALDHYAHFTSPIRRYPDLLIHRGIRHIIRDGKIDKFDYNHADMVALGEHSSMTERRAEDASRDVVAWLKCEFMQDKVGEIFEGIITSVLGFGLFVELKDTFVEGLVHITALNNDYYHFDATTHQLTGERTNQRYRLGDTITVMIARVDLDERKIDFTLPSMPEQKARPKKSKSRKGSKAKSKSSGNRTQPKQPTKNEKKQAPKKKKATTTATSTTATKPRKGKKAKSRSSGNRTQPKPQVEEEKSSTSKKKKRRPRNRKKKKTTS